MSYINILKYYTMSGIENVPFYMAAADTNTVRKYWDFVHGSWYRQNNLLIYI